MICKPCRFGAILSAADGYTEEQAGVAHMACISRNCPCQHRIRTRIGGHPAVTIIDLSKRWADPISHTMWLARVNGALLNIIHAATEADDIDIPWEKITFDGIGCDPKEWT